MRIVSRCPWILEDGLQKPSSLFMPEKQGKLRLPVTPLDKALIDVYTIN